MPFRHLKKFCRTARNWELKYNAFIIRRIYFIC